MLLVRREPARRQGLRRDVEVVQGPRARRQKCGAPGQGEEAGEVAATQHGKAEVGSDARRTALLFRTVSTSQCVPFSARTASARQFGELGTESTPSRLRPQEA